MIMRLIMMIITVINLIMQNFLVSNIEFYQKHISKHLPCRCPYTPTCSHYAKEAIEKYGAWKGGRLAVWRLMRCNPFTKGGYDPVP